MSERYFPDRIWKELEAATTYKEKRDVAKEAADAVPTELEITRFQEKAIFAVFRDFLKDPASNWNEINGKFSPGRLEQIESIRAIMPRLARDIGYTGEHEGSPLNLMFMGLSKMVPIETLEKIRDEKKSDYEKRHYMDRKPTTTKFLLDTAEYFLKRKKEETKSK